MRKLVLAMIATLAVTNASALERIYSADATCSQIKSVLERDGAAIIYYPSRSIPGLNLFNRFAKSANFCDSGRTQAFAIKTSDSNVCKVRICQEQRDDRSN